MAMVNYVTARTSADSGVAVSRYRNLLNASYADVVQVGASWYLHGITAKQEHFYFGALAGYPSEAAAVTAITTLLP